MRKDADFTGKIKSAVAGGGRNRYNKDSVFLSLDIEETTGGQYAEENRIYPRTASFPASFG